MRIPGGYLVGIEGIDAVGKDTQSRLLYGWLSRGGVKATRMSFPDYDTPIGHEIKSFLSGLRKYPVELQHLLFAANRWERSEEIRARLQADEIMIVNRYTESNLAYGVANGLKVEWLANLENGLPIANLVIVLDAAPRSLDSRRAATSKDANEKNQGLQLRAQRAYRDFARERGWKLIDAKGTIRDVEAEIIKTVRRALSNDRGVAV